MRRWGWQGPTVDEMGKRCLHSFLLDSDLGDLSEGGIQLWREKGKVIGKEDRAALRRGGEDDGGHQRDELPSTRVDPAQRVQCSGTKTLWVPSLPSFNSLKFSGQVLLRSVLIWLGSTLLWYKARPLLR